MDLSQVAYYMVRKGPSYFYRTGNGISSRLQKTVAHVDREGARKIRKAVKALWPDEKVVLVRVKAKARDGSVASS